MAVFINFLFCFLIPTVSLIVFVRYAQIKELLVSYQFSSFWRKLNFIAFIIGMISTLGMTMVANFQESAMLRVHLTGAVLCFGGATFYLILQVLFFNSP